VEGRGPAAVLDLRAAAEAVGDHQRAR